MKNKEKQLAIKVLDTELNSKSTNLHKLYCANTIDKLKEYLTILEEYEISGDKLVDFVNKNIIKNYYRPDWLFRDLKSMGIASFAGRSHEDMRLNCVSRTYSLLESNGFRAGYISSNLKEELDTKLERLSKACGNSINFLFKISDGYHTITFTTAIGNIVNKAKVSRNKYESDNVFWSDLITYIINRVNEATTDYMKQAKHVDVYSRYKCDVAKIKTPSTDSNNQSSDLDIDQDKPKNNVAIQGQSTPVKHLESFKNLNSKLSNLVKIYNDDFNSTLGELYNTALKAHKAAFEIYLTLDLTSGYKISTLKETEEVNVVDAKNYSINRTNPRSVLEDAMGTLRYYREEYDHLTDYIQKSSEEIETLRIK